MASDSKSLLGTLMMPVMDLLLILTVGFLATGGYIGALVTAEDTVRASQQHNTVNNELESLRHRLAEQLLDRNRILKKLKWVDKSPEKSIDLVDIELSAVKVKDEIKRFETELRRLFPNLAALAREVRELKEKADAYGRGTVARNEMTRETVELAEEVDHLKEEKNMLGRRLASLEAQKAREENLNRPVKLGVSIARKRSNLDKQFFIVIAEGLIYPLTKEFYDKTPAPDYVIWSVKKDGLKISDALGSSSPIMGKTRVKSFVRDGTMVMLVNNDSFGTFRVLRDKLLALGIDYAWEPWERGTEVLTSSRGTTRALSQGMVEP